MDHLIKAHMERNALLPAIIANETIFSYQAILACCTQLEQLLAVKQGDVVYVRGNYCAASVAALLWALDKNIIIIPVVNTDLKNYMAIIPANYIIECAAATYTITHQSSSFYCHDLTSAVIAKNHSGLVIFTSGTSGVPKAAFHDFNIFIEKYKLLTKKISAICFLNFDHIGGLNTLFSVFFAGAQLVIPGSTQPQAVATLIEKYEIELLPTTPSFLRMLLMSNVTKTHKLHSLKMISYGTEFMPEETLKKIKTLFPHVKLKQTYGSTEIGILATQSKADDSTLLKIDIEKTPYKVQEGLLWIKIKNCSFLGYLNAELTILDNWVNTQDRVEQHGDYLKILGRASELINVGGEKVDPHEVEAVLLQCEGVKDAQVFGKSNPVLGQVVIAKIAYLPEVDPQLLKKKIHAWSLTHLPAYKQPAYFILTSDIIYSSRWKKMEVSHAG